METYFDQPDRGFKRALAFLAAGAACAAISFACFVGYITPVDYVSIDINPSVEFSLNIFGKVLSAKAYNWDGELLLGTDSYTHHTLDNAVYEVVGIAAKQGYLVEDGSTAIAVAAESVSVFRANRWLQLSEETIQLALREQQHAAVLYSECLTPEQRARAVKSGISPGRFSLIERLRQLDYSVDPEQYRNAGITDMLMAAGLRFPATEMWLEGQTGALEKIWQTVGQIQLQRSGVEMVLGTLESQDTETPATEQTDAGSEDTNLQTGTGCGYCRCGCPFCCKALWPSGR